MLALRMFRQRQKALLGELETVSSNSEAREASGYGRGAVIKSQAHEVVRNPSTPRSIARSAIESQGLAAEDLGETALERRDNERRRAELKVTRVIAAGWLSHRVERAHLCSDEADSDTASSSTEAMQTGELMS